MQPRSPNINSRQALSGEASDIPLRNERKVRFSIQVAADVALSYTPLNPLLPQAPELGGAQRGLSKQMGGRVLRPFSIGYCGHLGQPHALQPLCLSTNLCTCPYLLSPVQLSTLNPWTLTKHKLRVLKVSVLFRSRGGVLHCSRGGFDVFCGFGGARSRASPG